MKNRLFFLLGALLAFNACAFEPRFDTVVIFGDSLSDNGNLYRFLWKYLPASPPYYDGRFSNGPVWVEQLYAHYFPANYTDGFQDYAVGGAGAVLSYKENLPFTLSLEISNYLYWHTHGKKSTSLYVIWIGANNYLNGPTNVEPITDSVTDAISSSVERLISVGGDKFLIINLPDMSRLPEAKDNHTQALLSQLSISHNRKLSARIEQLHAKYPDKLFIYFDAYSYLNYAIDHANDFGLTNVDDPCYMGGYTGLLKLLAADPESLYQQMKQQYPKLSQQQWAMINNNPDLHEALMTSYSYSMLPPQLRSQPLQCEGYLFWDHVHPTTTTHRLIAQQVQNLIDDAGLVAVVTAKTTEPAASQVNG